MSFLIAATSGQVASCGDQAEPKVVQVGEQKYELIYQSPGTFEMGDSRVGDLAGAVLNWEASRGNDEGPPRRVTLTRGFYIGRYKVTCEQFCEFLNDADDAGEMVDLNQFSRIERAEGNYRPKKGCERSAINVVHWKGAVAFCEWLSRKSGQSFRLPTEAEWEYAARGKEGRTHPWGNGPRKAQEVGANQNCQPVQAATVDVTPEGVVGMASDWTHEWCSDYYGIRYLAPDVVDPKGPSKDQLPIWSDNALIATVNGQYHVLRGRSSVATRRSFGSRVDDAGIYGLRIVMEADNPAP